MGLIAARWICAFICIVQGSLCAKSTCIQVEERRDYEILDRFFQMGILEEEYGYVLEGVKPVSARMFYPLDIFPMKDLRYSENEFKKTLLVRETIPVWNRLCAHQDRFVLKAVDEIGFEPSAGGFEVQFIHVPKLREVITENINLFRYILGPALEVGDLVNRLAYSSERFTDILQDNLTLIGIVLGFGTHNSLMGGRLETLDQMAISKDCPPFLPKSRLLQEEDGYWMYGTAYLACAGGDETFFKKELPQLHSQFSLSAAQKEIHSLRAKAEPLPRSLGERPRFIFGAFKGGLSNQPLFLSLQKAQVRSKALLEADHKLSQILERIGGKKPRITCDRSPTSRSVFSLVSDTQMMRQAVLKGVAQRFTDPADKEAFWQSFISPASEPVTPPPLIGASREILKGLKQALDNLTVAQNRMLALSKDPSLRDVVSQQLYVKTLQQGTGKSVEGIDRIRLGYVIEDVEGNVLFANHDTWIHLSDTIPGFLHGLQGMHIGEKRTLFIHPALGYGPLTTLPPCSLLVAHVHLLDADFSTTVPIPAVTPLNFNWVQDPRFQHKLEESLTLLPTYAGTFYRQLLEEIAN